MDACASKNTLRQELRARRAALAPPRHSPAVVQAGQAVARELLAVPWFQRARCVAVYQAIGDEFDPAPVGAAARRSGAVLCAPRVAERRPPTLAFHAFGDGPEDLVPGPLGILEPRSDRPECHAIDVFIVPGLGFDRAGHRLGYGRGFYDAALRAHPSAARIACCYPFQLVQAVPAEPHDEPVDLIATPSGVLFTGARPQLKTHDKEDR